MGCLKLKPNVGSRSINHAASVMQFGQRSGGSFNFPVNQTMRTSSENEIIVIIQFKYIIVQGFLQSFFSLCYYFEISGLWHRQRDDMTQLWWHQSEATKFHWWKWQRQAWIPSISRFFLFYIFSMQTPNMLKKKDSTVGFLFVQPNQYFLSDST